MKFVNRHQEMARLDRLTKSNQAEMAVVWGRRRLGKTRLLLEWAHKHKGIYFTADESAATLQRKYFSNAIEQAIPGFAGVEYTDWTSFFTRLARDAQQFKWRGPLIIDELPYLIACSPELPSILQKYIDHEAKQCNMITVLCGSSQRMMQGSVLDASAPLFGRASEIIKLGPLNIGYLGEALGIKDAKEILQAYSIWGGIPRYWELVKSYNGTFLETVDDIVLNPMGPLNEEPNRLLLEESATSLRPILDAIGLGAHRLSEVATRIGQPVTSFTRMIQRLIELDLIEREVPFGINEHNTKRTLYKIKDPFMRFWFDVIAPKRSFFAQAPSSHRKSLLKESLPRIFSLTWEELCRQVTPLIDWKGPLFSKTRRYWHGTGPEWDILAESVDGKAYFIGEAKWLSKIPTDSFVYKTIEEIKNRGFPPISRNTGSQLFYGLFIPEKPKHLKLPSNVKVLDCADVIGLLRY